MPEHYIFITMVIHEYLFLVWLSKIYIFKILCICAHICLKQHKYFILGVKETMLKDEFPHLHLTLLSTGIRWSKMDRWRSGEQEEEVDLNQKTWQAPSASNISTTSPAFKWQWKDRWSVLWPVTFGGFNGRITDSYEPQLYWEQQSARHRNDRLMVSSLWFLDGEKKQLDDDGISKDLLSSPEYKLLSDSDYILVGILARNSDWD